MKIQYTLKTYSWPDIIELIWKLQEQIRQKNVELDWRTCIELFGPGSFEVAVRDPKKQEGFLKMIPKIITVSTKYLECGGKVDQLFLDTVSASLFAAKQDQFFADALSGKKDTTQVVNWAAVNANISKLLYILSRKLSKEKSTLHAAYFLQKFRFYGRDNLTSEEESILSGLELQSGLGIFSAICDAKKILPELRPEELAGTMIQKYGIPDDNELLSCSWCGDIPCSCDGRKSNLRKVSEDDVSRYILEVTPWHTMQCMELSYGLARNSGIAGDGYGPARVSYERAEALVAKLFMEADGNPVQLANMFDPMFNEDQRQFNRYQKAGDIGKPRAQHDLVKELGDTIQWLMLILSGKIDHAKGLVMAIENIAERMDIDLLLPAVPELSLPPLEDQEVIK